MLGEIKAICISEKKGTAKKAVESAKLIENYGIENDAHAGNWHRQVSLLAFETREDFNKAGANVDDGAFGENIIVSGFELTNLKLGTRFKIGEAELELTQIGKECHSHCEIYHRVGTCIMPTNGVFTKVIKGGEIKKGDIIECIE